jgi:hypothetical protein
VPTLHDFLVFLHVVSTAAWLAAGLWVAGDVRRTLDLGRPHVDALAGRVRPALGLDAAAGVATLVTGALLLWEAGMGHPRLGISLGIVFTLARLALLALARRSWRSILGRLQQGEPVAPRDPAARRLGMLGGIAHTLWLLALAGMVFPI